MNERPAPSDPYESRQPVEVARRQTIWPNLVWAIPIAAVLVCLYLGIQALANRGETITVTFDRAAGARVGETKVVYQGIDAGQVVKIEPNKDGRRLDFKLRMVKAAKSGLNSNARFWLIGANPNLADLSSLKAVVSGVAIGYAPGEGGTPAAEFEGLDKAPLILPSDKGTRYLLQARTLNSIREGTVVLFHGQPVGKVTEVQFDGKQAFKIEIFMYQPYDSLVRSGVRFWKISPLRLSFGGGGITANVAPASTLLSGGVDLEVNTATPDAPQSAAKTEFTLYSSHNAARQGLSGQGVAYEFAFDGDAGALTENAAVNLLGFQVGEVQSARLAYDAKSGEPYTIATAVLYPQQLHIVLHNVSSDEAWRSATDAMLQQLVRLGYRARLEQTPMFVGDESIDLVKVHGAAQASLSHDGAATRFPTAGGSSDIGALTAKTDQILDKLNRVPLEDIGNRIRDLTMHADEILKSPDLKDSVRSLRKTLDQVDKILAEAQPQIGPLLKKLTDAAGELSNTAAAAHQLVDGQGGGDGSSINDTLRQLGDAARSLQSLTDYLGRHPEALIRGKRPDK